MKKISLEGHSTHAPLTDLVIGSFTLATVCVILSWLGLSKTTLHQTAVVAIIFGLIMALPTWITGFIDYFKIPNGTSRQKVASFHLGLMIAMTFIYALSLVFLQKDVSNHVHFASGITSIIGICVMSAGGWLGGSLVFRYGIGVVNHPDDSVRDAVLPHRAVDEETL